MLEHPSLSIQLQSSAIPSYPGALALLGSGISSTLAPANRAAWRLLEGSVRLEQPPAAALLELLVDPQTCGPLLVACTSDAAEHLTQMGPWIQIGTATTVHG